MVASAMLPWRIAMPTAKDMVKAQKVASVVAKMKLTWVSFSNGVWARMR